MVMKICLVKFCWKHFMEIFSEIFENLKTLFPRFQRFLLLVGNISYWKRGGTMVIRRRCLAFVHRVQCSILLEECLVIFSPFSNSSRHLVKALGKNHICALQESNTWPTHSTLQDYRLATNLAVVCLLHYNLNEQIVITNTS